MSEPTYGEEISALMLLVAALDATGVHYLLTGSVALGMYTQPRLTRDVDVIIFPRRDQRRPLANVLAEDFDADRDVMLEALREMRMFNVITRDTVVKLDLIPKNFDAGADERERSRLIQVGEDDSIAVLSPEDLLVAKLDWAKSSRSETQFRDIRLLLERESLDLDLVKRLAAHRGLRGLLDELTARE